MSVEHTTDVGAVASIWRYPVKSMIGEELSDARVSQIGLTGDRVYALVDRADGKIATAKNPRKWPTLFAFRANLIDRPDRGSHRATVRITLPDGRVVRGEEGRIDSELSKALGRDVSLVATTQLESGIGAQPPAHASKSARAEEYWPDMDGLDHRDTVTDFDLPTGTFFDCATVHILTTATLDRLRESYTEGRFDVRRFRPNIVVSPASGEPTFVENAWIGHRLAIGPDVRLNITGPCGRCVMTTLAQGDLPMDTGILRTAVRQNRANVGVYATVVRSGVIHRGDRVRLGAA